MPRRTRSLRKTREGKAKARVKPPAKKTPQRQAARTPKRSQRIQASRPKAVPSQHVRSRAKQGNVLLLASLALSGSALLWWFFRKKSQEKLYTVFDVLADKAGKNTRLMDVVVHPGGAITLKYNGKDVYSNRGTRDISFEEMKAMIQHAYQRANRVFVDVMVLAPDDIASANVSGELYKAGVAALGKDKIVVKPAEPQQ